MNTREGHRIIADEEEKTGVYIESGGPKSPTSAAAAPLGERQQQPGNDQALFPTSLSIWDDPEDMEPFTSMGMECIPSGSDAEFLCGLA